MLNPQIIHWLILSLALWSLVIFMIPWGYIKKLWLPSFFSGFLFTYVINYLAVSYLHLWAFPATFLTFLQTPLFLAICWYGAMMIFGYFIMVYSRFKVFLVVLFAVATALIFYDASVEGHLKLGHWSIAETLFLGIFTHIQAVFILRWFVKDIDLKPNDKPFGNQ
jgi:hypothetical protein